MTFHRVKTDKRGNKYLYREERYREGRKVRSRSTYLGRVGGGQSPGPLVPALPFMIAYDLISGNRVKALSIARAQARERGHIPTAWQQLKGTASKADRAAMYRAYASSEREKARDPAFLAARAEMSAKLAAETAKAAPAPAPAETNVSEAPSVSGEAPAADGAADGGTDDGG
jgi:hypothetical protein